MYINVFVVTNLSTNPLSLPTSAVLLRCILGTFDICFRIFFLQKLISSRKVISLHQKSIFIPIDRYRGVCFIPKSVLFIFNTIATHSSSRCTANKVFLHRKSNQRGFFQMLGYPIVIQVKLDPLLLCANTQKGEGASSLLSFHRVCVFFLYMQNSEK